MNDDQLDDLLRREAQSYHLPPEPPRDAMWEEIERARARAGIVSITSARRMRWIRTAGGVAAVLVLGIAIGRLSRTGGRGDTTVSVASAPSTVDTGATSPDSAPVGDVERAAGPADELTRSARSGTGGRPAAGGRAYAVRGSARDAARRLDDPRDAVANGGMSAYRMAVVEHMTRTELLLTSFRAQSHNASREQMDAQFASLARDLLQTTRLLLATRSNEDPQLTRLLEDLELVLMQISQYAAEGRRGDLEAINQSLDRRNVLPKLRSNIPAGTSGT